MQMRGAAFIFLCALAATTSRSSAQESPPAWAYVSNPDFKLKPDDGAPKHVPDSALAFTRPQTRDYFLAPDWHPDDHPPMPAIVATGRRPDTFACGFCHRPDGTGGPENARLAGLSMSYIIEQVAKFKDGSRASSTPEHAPERLMVKVARAASDTDILIAAAYFSGLVPKQVIKVVETATVPVTEVAGSVLIDSKSGRSEPIGHRIIEVPEDDLQLENRDARARFIAYVPIGSIRRGEALANSGHGNTALQCTGCHGPGLNGVGTIPGLSGRSPSYIVRQLYDFKHGTRTGGDAERMRLVAAAISPDDMIDLAAYAASLPLGSAAQ